MIINNRNNDHNQNNRNNDHNQGYDNTNKQKQRQKKNCVKVTNVAHREKHSKRRKFKVKRVSKS